MDNCSFQLNYRNKNHIQYIGISAVATTRRCFDKHRISASLDAPHSCSVLLFWIEPVSLLFKAKSLNFL